MIDDEPYDWPEDGEPDQSIGDHAGDQSGDQLYGSDPMEQDWSTDLDPGDLGSTDAPDDPQDDGPADSTPEDPQADLTATDGAEGLGAADSHADLIAADDDPAGPADPSADPAADSADVSADPAADHLEPLPEPAVGTEPDLDPVGDDPSWLDPAFPPALELAEAPEPVDGYPWADPGLLGDGPAGDDGTGPASPDGAADGLDSGLDNGGLDGGGLDDGGVPPVTDLLSYDGLDPQVAGGDPWGALAASDDPATSSLARWWGPDQPPVG